MVEPVKKKKKRVNSDGEEEEDEEEEEEQEEEPAPEEEEEDEAKKKKKLEPQPPVAPVLIGRPEPSTRDTMIEIETKALIQSSSTMLAVSCFHEKQVIICNVDIKTRDKTIKQRFKNKSNPTFLYQIDKDHMLVGTLAGKFEIWNVDPNQEEPTIKQVVDAHPGSEQGISQIIKLQDPSPLIKGDRAGDDECEFLVSTAADKPEIIIWKLSAPQESGKRSLKVHI